MEKKIINLLSDIEQTVSELYKVYANKYPEYKNFWIDLSNEEVNHAKLMKCLLKYITHGVIALNTKKANEGAVTAVLNHFKDRLERARAHQFSLKEALRSALEIEKNIIEKDFCSFFEGDDAEFKKVCETIIWETSQHRNKISEALEKL